MGVYIKGMKMPSSCDECPLYTCMHNHADCPLVEIPPHGRLIDVEAPIRFEVAIDAKMHHTIVDIYAPTVIEAEEENT